MTEKVKMVPLSEDALNRYRITHPDRDLRPLLRRIHRLSAYTPPATDDLALATEHENEVEMARLELIKWKSGIERIMGSVENLNRQREVYLRRAKETVDRTEELKATLDSEKILLAKRQRERDEQIKCDEVAAKITAKGKTRAELDEQITSLQQSLVDHRASHELYAETVQSRIDLFSQITKLVDDVRGTKLPIDPQASIEEAVVEQPVEDKMEVDDPAPAGSSTSAAARLNASALPFQPTRPTTSAPNTRDTSPAAPTKSSMKPAPASHGLPSRPARAPASAANLPTAPTHKIPGRPPTLRSVTTPVAGTLEEGEVGGEEEGEVNEDARAVKRAAGGEARTRSTRPRR